MIILQADHQLDIVFATYDQDEPRHDGIIRAYGTAQVPTPFTSRMDRAMVINCIAGLNPSSVIRWEEGEQ